MPSIQAAERLLPSPHRLRPPTNHNLRRILETQYLDKEIEWIPGTSRKYITKQNLRRFWRNHESVQVDIERSLQENHAKQSQYISFWDEFPHFYRIACVLIWIEEELLYTILPQIIARQHGRLTDRDLPWLKRQGEQQLGAFRDQFYETQYLFVDPIDIGEPRQFLPHFDARIPLPFVEPVESLGYSFAASHARLKRVCVKKLYLHVAEKQELDPYRTASNGHSPEIDGDGCVDVACRVLPQSCDVDSDMRNNSALSQRLRSHTNIVKLIDVIHRGDQLYFFWPFPALGDLESLLLSCRGLSESSQVAEERLLSSVQALYGVVEALCHLFPEDGRGARVELNLTPQNILIYSEPGAPFGRWKLLDIRIASDRRLQHARDYSASIRAESHNGGTSQPNNSQALSAPGPTLPVPSSVHSNSYGHVNISDISGISGQAPVILGNVYLNIHNNAERSSHLPPTGERAVEQNAFISRSDDILRSPYRAPELALGSSCFGEKSNVWSLGCIFVELLSFNQCFGHQSCMDDNHIPCLHHLRNGLESGPFFALRTSQVRNETRPEISLQEYIRCWLEQLVRQPLYRRSVKTANDILRFWPEERYDAKALLHSFDKLLESLASFSPYSAHSARNFSETSNGDAMNAIEQLGRVERASGLGSWPVEPLNPAVRYGLTVWQPSSKSKRRLRITRDYVLLFSKPPTSATDLFWIRSIDPDLSSHFDQSDYELPAAVNWEGLELNGRYGSAYTKVPKLSEGNSEVQYFLFDVQRAEQCKLPVAIEMLGELQSVVPAATGLVAFVFNHTITLRPLEGSVSDPIIPLPTADFEISRVVFSKDGQQLFVYTTRGTEHMVQAWDVGTSQRPDCIATVIIELDDRHLSFDKIHLLPCNRRDACLIFHEKLLKPAVAQRGHDQLRCRKTISLDNNLAATVSCLSVAANGTHLVLVEGAGKRYIVRAYQMDFTVQACTLTELGAIDLCIEKKQRLTWVVVRSQSMVKHEFHILARDTQGTDYFFGTVFPATADQKIQLEPIARNKSVSKSLPKQASGSWLGRAAKIWS